MRATMRSEYTIFGAIAIFFVAIMAGCFQAHGMEMKNCLDANPMVQEKNDPLWSVYKGTDLLKIEEEEDDADVDHCYDPLENLDEVYGTKRTGGGSAVGRAPTVFKPVPHAA